MKAREIIQHLTEVSRMKGQVIRKQDATIQDLQKTVSLLEESNNLLKQLLAKRESALTNRTQVTSDN